MYILFTYPSVQHTRIFIAIKRATGLQWPVSLVGFLTSSLSPHPLKNA